MSKLMGVVALLLLAGCGATGPREGERDRGGASPPRLDQATLERVGRVAGERLRSALGPIEERVATDRVVFVLPSRELADVDESPLVDAFVEGARIRTAPGTAELASSALTVRVSGLVRRAPEGTVALDYAFAFTYRRGADVPWSHVEHATVEGARGALEPQALASENLDALAEAGAREVARILKSEGRVAAALLPANGIEENPGVVVGFEDRLRAALVREHVRLGTGEALPRIVPTVSFERLDHVTGSETHRFVVELFEASNEVPRSRWERQTTVTGGRGQ